MYETSWAERFCVLTIFGQKVVFENLLLHPIVVICVLHLIGDMCTLYMTQYDISHVFVCLYKCSELYTALVVLVAKHFTKYITGPDHTSE